LIGLYNANASRPSLASDLEQFLVRNVEEIHGDVQKRRKCAALDKGTAEEAGCA